jgi:hypothetical protein
MDQEPPGDRALVAGGTELRAPASEPRVVDRVSHAEGRRETLVGAGADASVQGGRSGAVHAWPETADVRLHKRGWRKTGGPLNHSLGQDAIFVPGFRRVAAVRLRRCSMER